MDIIFRDSMCSLNKTTNIIMKMTKFRIKICDTFSTYEYTLPLPSTKSIAEIACEIHKQFNLPLSKGKYISQHIDEYAHDFEPLSDEKSFSKKILCEFVYNKKDDFTLNEKYIFHCESVESFQKYVNDLISESKEKNEKHILLFNKEFDIDSNLYESISNIRKLKIQTP